MAGDTLGLWVSWLTASSAAAGLAARFSPRGRGPTPPPPGEFLAALFERLLEARETATSSSALEATLQFAARAAGADHLSVAAIVPGTREWRILAAAGSGESGEPQALSETDPLVIEILKGERVLVHSGARDAFPGTRFSTGHPFEALAALPLFQGAHQIGGLVAALSERPWAAPQQTLEVLTGLAVAISMLWERANWGELKVASAPVQPPADRPAPKLRPIAKEGTETILLVEDDPAVRDLTLRFLKLKGFTVLPARDGAQALDIAQNHPGPIHLLLTDLVMPEILGPEVARGFRQFRPQSKVLFMSGYGGEEQAGGPETPPGSWFLSKPFKLQTLVRKVREVLDHPSTPSGPPAFPPGTKPRP